MLSLVVPLVVIHTLLLLEPMGVSPGGWAAVGVICVKEPLVFWSTVELH